MHKSLVYRWLFASPNWLGNIFWLGLSVALPVFYGRLGYLEAFQVWHQIIPEPYVVQDDARQHVFWMQRWLDPQLFPNDLIADYFQSVAPFGYSQFYKAFVDLGIDPFLFNKLLPPFLAAIATIYAFRFCYQILPVPLACFLATLLLNLSLWMNDDIPSATPRAFVYPFFLAFLYYFSRQALFPCLIAIALTGLFYPQYVLVEGGILTLAILFYRRWYVFYGTGLAVVFLVLAAYAFKSSDFGPTISLEYAKSLPEFWEEGRSSFFDRDWIDFWITGGRSGFFPEKTSPIVVWLAVLFPFLLKFSQHFPLTKRITSNLAILPQIVIAGFGLFFLAHTFLFSLHLPSRYTSHSLKIVMALAAGMAIAIFIDYIFQWQRQRRGIWLLGKYTVVFSILAAMVFHYPLFIDNSDLPNMQHRHGRAIQIYRFFQEQPKNITIASIAEEANNIPSLSKRSIFVGREYAIPYQLGYYNPFRQRAIATVRAQYTLELSTLQKFIQDNQISFWLLHRSAFVPEYINNHRWLEGFLTHDFPNDVFVKTVKTAMANLKSGKVPAIARTIERCSQVKTDKSIVLDATCITDMTSQKS
jgi:hypothetical protein